MTTEETKELTPEEQLAARRSSDPAFCAAERATAKERMLARNDARIADLKTKGVLNDGETLEEFDTRTNGEFLK